VATPADDGQDKAEGAEPEAGSNRQREAQAEGNGGPGKARKCLKPEDKYQIFLECQRGDVPIAAVLRKWGIHSSDLTRIRAQVREGALEGLARGSRKGRRPKEAPEVTALKTEKARVEEALKELAIENTLLRKKVS
jgi:transposase-like protein